MKHILATSPFTFAFLPYLMMVAFPLAILAGNVDNLPPPAAIAKTIGLLLLIVFLTDVSLRFFVHRSPCRELAFCAAILYVMAYGYLAEPLRFLGIRQVYFFPIWSVLFLTAILLTARHSRSRALTRAALLLQYILVAMVCLQGAWLGVVLSRELILGDCPELASVVKEESSPTVPPRELPDIYYIILDGYGREDILRERYQFDNRDFVESLKKRGFQTPAQSRSNYSQTALSLASSLNMRYLNELKLDEHNTRWPLHNMIQNSEAVQCLKRHGYKTVAVQSGYSLTECPSFDRYISVCPFRLYGLQAALYRTTLLFPMEYFIACQTGTWYTTHRRLVLGDLAAIPKAAEGFKSPCFVFSHILLPHPPFVFDAKGNPVNPSLNLFKVSWSRREYTDQIAFINQQVLRIVDEIQSGSNRPSLIILQGDHGPDTKWFGGKTSQADRLKERFAILNAIRMPPGVDVELYSALTPVNTFRLILNHYFHTNLDLLEDRCFFSEYSNPYAFQETTSETREIIADRRQDSAERQRR